MLEGLSLHDESFIKSFSAIFRQLSDNALFALIEYGAMNNSMELMAKTFLASLINHHGIHYRALLRTNIEDLRKELFWNCDNSDFACYLCHADSSRVAAWLDWLHFELNPNMICRICAQQIVRVEIVKVVINHIDCNQITFTLICVSHSHQDISLFDS